MDMFLFIDSFHCQRARFTSQRFVARNVFAALLHGPKRCLGVRAVSRILQKEGSAQNLLGHVYE